MKRILILIAMLSILNYTYGQEQNEYFFPNSIKETGTLDENGYPIGVWKYYKDNGSLEYIINWETNFIKMYYNTGALKEKGTFIPETGVHIGEWITYYKNGDIKTQEVFDEDGVKIKKEVQKE